MKKFKTYGKTVSSNNMKTSDWDDIVSTPNRKEENQCEETRGLEDKDDLNELFEGLSVTASTPKILPSQSIDLDYSFKCSRSISFVFQNKKPRKKHSSLKSTEYNASDCSLCSADGSFFKDVLCSFNGPVTSKQKILDLCCQTDLLDMESYVQRYSEVFVRKLGEGSYGEVFEKNDADDTSIAVKIVPVGKDTLVNGYPQMTLDEVIPEMAVSKKLLNLGISKENVGYTAGFVQLKKLLFCQGSYPAVLRELWDEWNEKKTSENDHPNIFSKDQTFVVFETNNGGEDLEHFKIKSVKEAISILKQTVASLAAAEKLYQFEHRDLHHGNILIRKTNKKFVDVVVDNQPYKIECNGLLVCIIDFTMARLYADGGIIYTDMATEESIFTGSGDIQFDVYRDMRIHNKNDWESYHPYTNVLWIKYLAEKLLLKLRKNVTIPKFIDTVLNYKTCFDIVKNDGLFTK